MLFSFSVTLLQVSTGRSSTNVPKVASAANASTSATPPLCEQCGRSFKTSAALYGHMRVHGGAQTAPKMPSAQISPPTILQADQGREEKELIDIEMNGLAGEADSEREVPSGVQSISPSESSEVCHQFCTRDSRQRAVSLWKLALPLIRTLYLSPFCRLS